MTPQPTLLEPAVDELTIRVHHPDGPVQQGSMTPYTRGGKPYCKPSNEAALKVWRAAGVEAAKNAARAAGWHRYDGPVTVRIDFYLQRPASAQTRPRPFKYPDLDKLVRAVFDFLTTAAIVVDDSRICGLTAEKHYARPGEPRGATIRVRNGPPDRPVVAFGVSAPIVVPVVGGTS